MGLRICFHGTLLFVFIGLCICFHGTSGLLASLSEDMVLFYLKSQFLFFGLHVGKSHTIIKNIILLVCMFEISYNGFESVWQGALTPDGLIYVQVLVSFSVLKTVLYLPLIKVLTLFYNDKSIDIDFNQNSHINIPNYKKLIAISKKLENFNENFIKNIDKIYTKIFRGILSRSVLNVSKNIYNVEINCDNNLDYRIFDEILEKNTNFNKKIYKIFNKNYIKFSKILISLIENIFVDAALIVTMSNYNLKMICDNNLDYSRKLKIHDWSIHRKSYRILNLFKSNHNSNHTALPGYDNNIYQMKLSLTLYFHYKFGLEHKTSLTKINYIFFARKLFMKPNIDQRSHKCTNILLFIVKRHLFLTYFLKNLSFMSGCHFNLDKIFLHLYFFKVDLHAQFLMNTTFFKNYLAQTL